MNPTVRKVGRITVAIGLVALGAGLLMDNLLAYGPSYTSLILRFWPILLIGFGLEYLLFSVIDRMEEGAPARLRFDFGGAILLFLLVGLTAGFNTVSHWLPNPGDYVIANIAGGGQSDRTDQATISADGAREIVVDIDLGRVELISQRLSEVRVESSYDIHGFFRLKDQTGALGEFELDLSREDDLVRLTAKAPAGLNLSGITASYKLYIPSGLKVKLSTGAGSILVNDYDGDLLLSSKFGTISAEATSGTLDAETGSGTIRIRQHDGDVVARTNAGSISARQVNGSLQLDSGTGLIEVEEYTGGSLVAETKTGSISVNTPAPLEGDLLLKTSAGAINLTVPADSSMKVTAQTKTGSISGPDFLTLTRSGASQSGVGISGDGKHVVTLEATMGSIKFNLR